MECPYCGNVMIAGRILGDRYALKWMPNEKSLLMGIFAHSSIRLGERSLVGRPSVDTMYCRMCKKMIINNIVE